MKLQDPRAKLQTSSNSEIGNRKSEMGNGRTLWLLLALAALAALNALGCSWRVPLSDRLSAAERAQLVEVERCCRSHGAEMWDGYVHSLPGT